MKTIFFIFFFFLPFLCFSQQSSSDKTRAESIFAIAKYFNWPNETSIDTFRIAVLDPKTSLEQELIKIAEVQKLMHKKPIKIYRYSTIDEIKNSTTIFANHDNDYDIDKILKKISGKHTLLITENYPFHKSMVNYIMVKNIRRYELNEPKLKEEGFSANELFIAGAVKSRADWELL